MSHDVSIILSTYSSDDYIKKYYLNITELINVAKIQLVHVLNDPTILEKSFIEKFLKLQLKVGKIKETKEISKIVLKIISEKYKNKTGMIFKV